MQRIGALAAAGIALAAAVLPALYEAAGKTMPETLFWASWSVVVGILLIGGPVWLYVWGISPILRWMGSKRYQWPMVDKNKPDPNQSILDAAKSQQENPGTHLRLHEGIAMSFSRDAKRPELWVRLIYMNYGINGLDASSPQGEVRYCGERLPDRIHDEGGRNSAGSYGQLIYDLRIYIPPEFLHEMCKEYDAGEIRRLDIAGLHMLLKARAADAREVGWSLGNNSLVFRVNGFPR